MITLGALHEQLVAEKLVAPEESWSSSGGSAWYITLLMGVGAWVAAILLLIVCGILHLLDNQGSALVLGLTCLTASVMVRQRAAGEFLRQLTLAGLLASEILVLWGTGDIGSPLLWGALNCLLLMPALAAFPDRAGRILTALVMGVVTLVVAMGDDTAMPPELFALGLALLGGFCWLRQNALLAGRFAPVQAPLGYACIITLFGLLQLSYWEWLHDDRRLGATATLLLTAAVLWMVARLQNGLKLPLGAGLASLGSVLALGLVTGAVPGIMAGVGVLVLGFAARNAVVQGLAWVYLVTFGTTFYYELSLTLLEKSGVLVLSGGLFLVLWAAVRRA